jgi:hypothetical protein
MPIADPLAMFKPGNAVIVGQTEDGEAIVIDDWSTPARRTYLVGYSPRSSIYGEKVPIEDFYSVDDTMAFGGTYYASHLLSRSLVTGTDISQTGSIDQLLNLLEKVKTYKRPITPIDTYEAPKEQRKFDDRVLFAFDMLLNDAPKDTMVVVLRQLADYIERLMLTGLGEPDLWLQLRLDAIQSLFDKYPGLAKAFSELGKK